MPLRHLRVRTFPVTVLSYHPSFTGWEVLLQAMSRRNCISRASIRMILHCVMRRNYMLFPPCCLDKKNESSDFAKRGVLPGLQKGIAAQNISKKKRTSGSQKERGCRICFKISGCNSPVFT